MLACTGLGEECVEGIITSTDGLVAWHLSVRLDTVLEAEELPACITNLDTALTEVQAEDLAHGDKECEGNVNTIYEFEQVLEADWLQVGRVR